TLLPVVLPHNARYAYSVGSLLKILPMPPRPPLLIGLFAIVAALARPAGAGDSWPGFRGPTADGRSDAKNLVTTWGEKENVRWKTAIHGKGWSSPVVLGNQVWVTTADEVAAEKAP